MYKTENINVKTVDYFLIITMQIQYSSNFVKVLISTTARLPRQLRWFT